VALPTAAPEPPAAPEPTDAPEPVLPLEPPLAVVPEPPEDAPRLGALPPEVPPLVHVLGGRTGTEGTIDPPPATFGTAGTPGTCGSDTLGSCGTDGCCGAEGVAARTGSRTFGGVTVGTGGSDGALGSPRSAAAESALRSAIAAMANTLAFFIPLSRFPQ
jgi:hypothetical protein